MQPISTEELILTSRRENLPNIDQNQEGFTKHVKHNLILVVINVVVDSILPHAEFGPNESFEMTIGKTHPGVFYYNSTETNISWFNL